MAGRGGKEHLPPPQERFKNAIRGAVQDLASRSAELTGLIHEDLTGPHSLSTTELLATWALVTRLTGLQTEIFQQHGVIFEAPQGPPQKRRTRKAVKEDKPAEATATDGTFEMKDVYARTGRTGGSPRMSRQIRDVLAQHGVDVTKKHPPKFGQAALEAAVAAIGPVNQSRSEGVRRAARTRTSRRRLSPDGEDDKDGIDPNFLNPIRLYILARVARNGGIGQISPKDLERLSGIIQGIEGDSKVELPVGAEEMDRLVTVIGADLDFFAIHPKEVVGSLGENDPRTFVLSVLKEGFGKNDTSPSAVFREMVERMRPEFTAGSNTLSDEEIFLLAAVFRSIFSVWRQANGPFKMKNVEFTITEEQSRRMWELAHNIKAPENLDVEAVFNEIVLKLKPSIGDRNSVLSQNPQNVHVLFEPFSKITDPQIFQNAIYWCLNQYQRTVQGRVERARR